MARIKPHLGRHESAGDEQNYKHRKRQPDNGKHCGYGPRQLKNLPIAVDGDPQHNDDRPTHHGVRTPQHNGPVENGRHQQATNQI